jgi:hypothetical protein
MRAIIAAAALAIVFASPAHADPLRCKDTPGNLPGGTVPRLAPGTVLRPGREVRPRLAGVILNFRDRAVGNLSALSDV